MDGNNVTMVNKGHTTRTPEESHPQQQSPPKGIPICNLQWRPAYHQHHMGYHRGRSTNCSTLGVYATPVHIWPQAPMPPGWVCGDHRSPAGGGTHGEWPAIHHHQHSIWGNHWPILVMGTAMMATWLLWHHTTSEVLVDIQTYSLAFVDLGLNPMAVDCLTLTLQELSDSDN